MKLRKEVEAVQTKNLRPPFGLIRLTNISEKLKYPTQLKASSGTSGNGRKMWKNWKKFLCHLLASLWHTSERRALGRPKQRQKDQDFFKVIGKRPKH